VEMAVEAEAEVEMAVEAEAEVETEILVYGAPGQNGLARSRAEKRSSTEIGRASVTQTMCTGTALSIAPDQTVKKLRALLDAVLTSVFPARGRIGCAWKAAAIPWSTVTGRAATTPPTTRGRPSCVPPTVATCPRRESATTDAVTEKKERDPGAHGQLGCVWTTVASRPNTETGPARPTPPSPPDTIVTSVLPSARAQSLRRNNVMQDAVHIREHSANGAAGCAWTAAASQSSTVTGRVKLMNSTLRTAQTTVPQNAPGPCPWNACVTQAVVIQCQASGVHGVRLRASTLAA